MQLFVVSSSKFLVTTIIRLISDFVMNAKVCQRSENSSNKLAGVSVQKGKLADVTCQSCRHLCFLLLSFIANNFKRDILNIYSHNEFP